MSELKRFIIEYLESPMLIARAERLLDTNPALEKYLASSKNL